MQGLTLGAAVIRRAKTPLSEAAGQIRFERVKIAPNTKRVPLPAMIYAENFTARFSPKRTEMRLKKTVLNR